MKKAMLTICLVVISFIGIGCQVEPTEWDPKTEKGWELWASGVIVKKGIDIDINNKRTFIIEFEGDLRVEETSFHNFHEVEKGDKGSVYKWTALNDRFMWVSDNNVTARIPKKKETGKSVSAKTIPLSTQIAEMKIEIPAQPKNDWQVAKTVFPAPYKTVLVKFGDGIVTTAYYTPTKDWKAEIDRKKLSGGIALKNVVEWKIVDLE